MFVAVTVHAFGGYLGSIGMHPIFELNNENTTGKSKILHNVGSCEGLFINKKHTVDKGLTFSHPLPGSHLPNSPWPGIMHPIQVPGRFGQK